MYGSQNLFVLGYIILHPNWEFGCSSWSHGGTWLGWLRGARGLHFFLRCSRISCLFPCAGGCDFFLCRFWRLRCFRLWCNFVWCSCDLCDLWLIDQNVPWCGLSITWGCSLVIIRSFLFLLHNLP